MMRIDGLVNVSNFATLVLTVFAWEWDMLQKILAMRCPKPSSGAGIDH